MVNLTEYSNSEIIELYSSILEELKKREIIRSNNVVGDLGEHIVIEKYHANKEFPNLDLAEASQQHFDAISRKGGKRYSIKTTTGNVTGVIRGLGTPTSPDNTDKLFDYLAICQLTKDYRPKAIYEIDWDTFLEYKRWHSTMNAWNINLTAELISKAKIVFMDESATMPNSKSHNCEVVAEQRTLDNLN